MRNTSSASPALWSALPRFHPKRVLQWTLPRRYYELKAKFTHNSPAGSFRSRGAKVEEERGAGIEHTAVTSNQMKHLLAAVAASQHMTDPIVEIGSFRGVTTRTFAIATTREVIAVDPYCGEGGHPKDLAYFEQHTNALANVRLLRLTSHEAQARWNGRPASMVFVDAIHEYLHAWYDAASWGNHVMQGGFVALHDVDDFSGVNLVCHKFLQMTDEWEPWSYVPNLAIFRRRA